MRVAFCFQVLDWLANHGEVFLRKNIGIGRNLQKARVYQKSHEHFENVAQVSDECSARSAGLRRRGKDEGPEGPEGR